jgi:Na+-translocating ferredoxin:NAD+ oxidoreductase RnfA subunit
MFLFDIAPDSIVSTPVGLAIAASFFLILAAIAFVAYKMVKRTVKMAFRMAIVAMILLIAIVGSISLWWFLSTPAKYERPLRPTVKSNR